MEYAMKKWTQLSMLLAKFQNTWWSSAEASAKEEWRVLAACSDTHINWPVPCYLFKGARHDLVNNLTEFYIGSNYQNSLINNFMKMSCMALRKYRMETRHWGACSVLYAVPRAGDSVLNLIRACQSDDWEGISCCIIDIIKYVFAHDLPQPPTHSTSYTPVTTHTPPTTQDSTTIHTHQPPTSLHHSKTTHTPKPPTPIQLPTPINHIP